MKKIGCLAIAIGALLAFSAPADAQQRDRSGLHLMKSSHGRSHSARHHRFRQGAQHLRRDAQFRRHHRFGDHRFRHHHFRHPHVGHRGGVRVFFGFGHVWPSPYYRVYSPPVIIHQPPPPPVYIQQEPHYWYYCADRKAYYPYVSECPEGWLRVVPHEPR